MKQGHASHSGSGQTKVEPKSQGVNPGFVSQIGNHIGNHAERGDLSVRPIPMYEGRGLKAPMVGSMSHHCGSQGRHK